MKLIRKIDNLIINYIEKYVTHPIQKYFGYTRVDLLRATMIWIAIFGVMEILFTRSVMVFVYLLVTALTGTLSYIFSYDFREYDNSLLENKVKNPLKIDDVSIIFRITIFLFTIIIGMGEFFRKEEFISFIALTSIWFAMILQCCDSLPPSQSKFKEWVTFLKKSLNPIKE